MNTATTTEQLGVWVSTDMLDLQRKLDTAVRVLSDMIPFGNMLVLYPCGCSAMGRKVFTSDASLPLYCGEHGSHENLNGTCVRGNRMAV